MQRHVISDPRSARIRKARRIMWGVILTALVLAAISSPGLGGSSPAPKHLRGYIECVAKNPAPHACDAYR